MPSTLSVAIITLNEEANLARTLASVQFASEIIVIDSGSTDHTLQIAESFHAKIFHEDWKGFAAQKNSAIEKCTGDWILSLDADEELTPELQTELIQLLQSDPASHADAYYLRRRNLFLNRWIRHGGFYPDPKLRLFRRETGIRFSERLVHETIQPHGRTAALRHDLIHHTYPTIELYTEHMNRYSTLGAQLIYAKGKQSRSLPAFAFNILIAPLFTLLWNYIFRLGFLDGREGLLLHVYHSAYTSWKYAKAWQLARNKPKPSSF
jgi:glycosyltransferase involved in cell wall biosynthesis